MPSEEDIASFPVHLTSDEDEDYDEKRIYPATRESSSSSPFSLAHLSVIERIAVGMSIATLTHGPSKKTRRSDSTILTVSNDSTNSMEVDASIAEILRIFVRRGRTIPAGGWAAYLLSFPRPPSHCRYVDRLYMDRISLGILLVELFAQTREAHLAIAYADILADCIIDDYDDRMYPTFHHQARRHPPPPVPVSDGAFMCLVVRRWQKCILEESVGYCVGNLVR